MKFEKGNKIGKGRPQGSKNNITIAMEEHGKINALPLWRRVMEQALTGDRVSQKMVLDRIFPIPKVKSYAEFEGLFNIKTHDDVNHALTVLLDGISKSTISLEEGEVISRIIDAKSKAIVECLNNKMLAMEKRIQDMEKNNG